MPPLEIAVWVIGALGLCGVALAFFKSDRLAVRLGALGVFGAFYLSVLALGWGGTDWFNATTIAIVLIALLSRMKAPLAPKPATGPAQDEPPAEAGEAPLPADHDDPDAASSDRPE